ncbi:hypothetical protein D3C87_1785930 [compost metagenome]
MARQQSGEVLAVPLAHLGRQGDQRGPVIKPGAAGYISCPQGEDIATPELDLVAFITGEGTLLRNLRLQLLFPEKLLDRLLRQLHPEHTKALACQPDHVQALATQGHQHLRTRLHIQARPVTL